MTYCITFLTESKLYNSLFNTKYYAVAHTGLVFLLKAS